MLLFDSFVQSINFMNSDWNFGEFEKYFSLIISFMASKICNVYTKQLWKCKQEQSSWYSHVPFTLYLLIDILLAIYFGQTVNMIYLTGHTQTWQFGYIYTISRKQVEILFKRLCSSTVSESLQDFACKHFSFIVICLEALFIFHFVNRLISK